ncbi:ZrgA family zinc uptake protein [Hyphobacterium sp.]|uniref:ZrgA family zinc uptake protein n=1 Tax=Hyphobacterium sp. TaxID=2004662 RepID=UPI003BAA10EF
MSFTHLLVSVAATALTQGEVHVHGHGTLTIGVDGNGNAEALFVVPTESLWGFERGAQSDEEQAAIDAAVARFQSAGLVTFSSGAGCELVDVLINTGADLHDSHHGLDDDHNHDDHSHDDHHHDEHDRDDHGHDDHHHDNNKMRDHDHGHGDHDHHEDHGHQDFEIRYVFECTNPGEINEIETTLFEAFPRLENIDGVFVDTDRQTGFELTPSQTSVRLP